MYPATSPDFKKHRGVKMRVLNGAFDPAYADEDLLGACETALADECRIYVQETEVANHSLERVFERLGRKADYLAKRIRAMDNRVSPKGRWSFQAYLQHVPVELLNFLPAEIRDRPRVCDDTIGCTELCFYLIGGGHDFTLIQRPYSAEELKENEVNDLRRTYGTTIFGTEWERVL